MVDGPPAKRAKISDEKNKESQETQIMRKSAEESPEDITVLCRYASHLGDIRDNDAARESWKKCILIAPQVPPQSSCHLSPTATPSCNLTSS